MGVLGSNLVLIIGGMLTFVFGLILGETVIDTSASTGTNANIGSFNGVQSINDLAPLAAYVAILVIGLGAMGLGGARAVGGAFRRK